VPGPVFVVVLYALPAGVVSIAGIVMSYAPCAFVRVFLEIRELLRISKSDIFPKTLFRSLDAPDVSFGAGLAGEPLVTGVFV